MNPLKTLFLTFLLFTLLVANAVAQTRTLYFYPPDDAKWIAGRSYISDGGQTAKPLNLEPSKCGWYKATYSGGENPPVLSQFWLGKIGVDKIGPKGRLAVDFAEGTPAIELDIFVLNDKFTQLGPNIYFVADELDPKNPNAGWYNTDPGIVDNSRCTFELAAFIYDTDPSVHPDFSCGRYYYGTNEGNGPNTYAMCQYGPAPYTSGGNLKPKCTGVVKGLAAANLNPQTRKIECGNCTKNGCWTNADWFKKAFEETPGVNVRRCYDMPFAQVKTGTAIGSFEFDSDRMLNANGRLVGGFFPAILTSRGSDDYSRCPNCDAKRDADRFPPLIKAITKERFDAYDSKEGDFSDGDTPPLGSFNLTPAAESIYDWSARDTAQWYLHGTTAIKNTYGSYTTYATAAQANQHFCFESHADFIYDPAQEFYFSGDDDIWVYINNKLVIDLGGNHMAAPGHIALKSLGLTEGERYPIDIFFCDKRTANSNVRITTNLYIAQKSNFHNTNLGANNFICAKIQGGDCASKMGMGITEDICGPALVATGYKTEFYMTRRGASRDTIWLSHTKNLENCEGASANDFICYSGIKVNNAVYSCGGLAQCKGSAEASEKVSVAGNFNVYVRLMDPSGVQVPGSKPILIDQFGSEAPSIIIDATGFYMVNHNNLQDTIWLSPTKNPEHCSGTGPSDFKCYGGIKVNNAVYSCGGASECRNNATATANVDITGNYDVYARLMQDGVLGELRLIDNISSDIITPILPRILTSNIKARTNGNTILLENLPSKAKVEIFNLQGKLIYSAYPENLKILKIGVQTKRMYIVKISLGSEKMVLKVF